MVIEYHRENGTKLTDADIRTQRLPTLFNVFPRNKNIEGTVSSMVFQLDDTYYCITPKSHFIKITGLEIKKSDFIIKTRTISLKYKIAGRLTDMIYELWTQ